MVTNLHTLIYSEFVIETDTKERASVKELPDF